MCLIMTENTNPSSTHLINIPVLWDDSNNKQTKKANLLIYTNDLKCDMNAGIMIVPIPNQNHDTNFGLVDVSTQEMKDFRKNLFDACDQLNQDFSYGMLSSNYAKSAVLKVHEVGNYSISVAPDMNALNNMIDWNRFQLPNDFDRRIATLSDKSLYPLENYAYVVAQANRSIEDDGFGIIYTDDSMNGTYFPTAHEDNGSSHIYDVKLYDCYSKQKENYEIEGHTTSKFFKNPQKIETHHLDTKDEHNSSSLSNFMKLQNLSFITSEFGTTNHCRIDTSEQFINYNEINGLYPNQNVIVS